jgi:LacI family transcriptional regulator
MNARSRADPLATSPVGFSASTRRSSAPGSGMLERPTLRTLAMSLNLSTAAVSLVLNARAGAESIPAVTRERILAAARGLHYRPNVLAQSLRRGRAFAIGVLVPDLAAAGSALAQAITDALRMAGYDVLLATHHRRPDLVAARARLMLERQVDGLIVADGGGIASAPVPVVRLTYTCDRRYASSASRIALDLAASADAAMQHVVELGHRRLALLSAAMPFGCSWGRALTRAARRSGVRIDTRRTGCGNVSAFERGYLAARDLIASRTLYTTLFTSDDDFAMGVIRALREHNLAVPRDVSVIGLETTWTPLPTRHA